MKGMIAQAKPQQREASPKEQGAYKNIVTQVVSFLAQPNVAAQVEKSIQQVGPEQAIAMAIMQALGMVGKAASDAGVDVATHTGKAAIKEIVSIMTAMLQAAGMVQDAQQAATAVMQIIAEMMFGQGQQGQSQQQPQPQQAQQPQQMGV